jgi:HAE1 family hydrophobic/amphiphilic exporter-1
MRKLQASSDVNSDLQITSPQVLVDIDRDKASALGVTADQIESALNSATARRRCRPSTRRAISTG